MIKYEERLCRTCKYGKKPEYHKPCVVYRDDCRLYEPIEEMTPEKAINTLKTWVERDEAMEYADRDENIEIYKMSIEALEQQPFINKPCISEGVCREDKMQVLDKIRAEIEKLRPNLRPEQMTDYDYAMVDVVNDIVAIIDKYKVESWE